MQGKLLTTEEVAQRVRTSAATVRYWRHMGTGPRGFKAGRRILYAEDDLMAWLDARLAAETADYSPYPVGSGMSASELSTRGSRPNRSDRGSTA